MAQTDKTALVTGASAGIGWELAKLFAADGHDLVLVARRRDKLEVLAAELQRKHGIRVIVLAEDLSDVATPGRIAKALEERGTAIELLVNNAGFGTTGAFAETDLARELSLIQVNVSSLVQLTRLLLPPMLKRRSGRILNIGSTAGFLPGPYMAGYYASKAFVNSFTQALAYELRGTGVTATVSCPGPTTSEFAVVAGNDKSRLFQSSGPMSAADVARHAYRSMMRGRLVAIPGFWNKLGMQSLRFAPRAMMLSVVGALNRSSDEQALPASQTR